MQEVIILKESEEIKVTACLQEEELVISLLDKISGGFYKSTFIYDALPKIIHQQTDNIRELLEFLVYKKEEINYKNQLVELQIECGLLRKRKIAELYLQKQEAIPTEVFQRQMQSFRNNMHRMVQQTQQQKRKSQALFESLKQKQLEIARLQTFISDLKKTQMQKVKIIEQNHISLTKMKTKIDQQQGKIIALFNQVQSERERSIKFIQYPKEMREIQYQQQKQLLERQKKIKELQTYNKLAERRNIELQRQSNKYQHLYQQASKERMRLLSERNFKEALSQARGPQQTYNQVYEYPIQKDCLQLQPKNRKQACRSLQIGQSGQMDLIAEQSQESFLTNHQEERIVDHKDNNVRQNSHINHHVRQKKPKKSDKSSVRGNLSEIKSRKSEEHTYLPLKFNIQEYSTKQKEQISSKNVLRALNGKDLTLLYSEQPFRRQGMQSCLVQVEQTNGKDLYIGLSVQKNDVNDELKLYMRGDGMISCRGRPASPNCKKKSIGNGDIVEFKLNFKLELLTIKVAGDTAATFQLPKQFVTRDVYFFVKLINSASIKYFGY